MSDSDPLSRVFDLLTKMLEGQIALEGKLDLLEGRLDRLRVDVMARVDRLQEQLTQQIETGIVSVSLATNTVRDANAARESASSAMETIGLLTQQVQRLNARVAALENKAGEP